MGHLAELNPYVPVRIIKGALTAEVLRAFAVVVCTQTLLPELLRINDVCRTAGIYFLAADCRGVFAYAHGPVASSELMRWLTGYERVGWGRPHRPCALVRALVPLPPPLAGVGRVCNVSGPSSTTLATSLWCWTSTASSLPRATLPP